MSNMVLCGVTVNDKDYPEFSQKKYKVQNDFKDGERTLCNIEQMAKMKDYRVHYPEFVKACQKIVEQAAREIKNYYASKDGRKGYNAMKHDNFQDYLRDLQEVHKKASEERQSLQANFNKAKEVWIEAQKDKKLSEYESTSAKMAFLAAEREYKEAVADLQKRTKEDVAVIRGEFEEHIEDFYSANGDRMDEGTIRLLNSGIRLTDKEIDRLVSQNISNPTMLRLISDHCDKNKIENKSVRIYGMRAKSFGKHETDIFNQVVGLVENATSKDDLTAKTWGSGNGHFERLSNEAIENMSGMVVKPEAGEPSEG